MNNKSENGKLLKETDAHGNNSLHGCNEHENTETTNSSTSEAVSKTENASSLQIIPEGIGASSVPILLNETSNQEKINDAEIPNRERMETNIFKVSTESDVGESSTVREIVGDDFSKKSEVNIVCECEPNVTGAAVPAVKSFIPTESQKSMSRCNNTNCNLSKSDLKQSDTSAKYGSTLQVHKDIAKHVSRIRQKHKEDIKEKSNTNKKFKCSPHTSPCLNSVTEKPNLESRSYSKKPSLIPKLTRPSSSNSKGLNYTKDDGEKRETVKLDTQKIYSKSKSSDNCVKTKEKKTTQLATTDAVDTKIMSENSGASSNTSNISSRMLDLQERLKATTSMLRQKIELDRSKENILLEESSVDSSVEEGTNKHVYIPSKKTVEDFYKSISCLKDIASTFSENSSLKNQTKYIEKLLSNISEIKLIADKLCINEDSKSKQDTLDDGNDSKVLVENKKSSATNTKDNRIYIKFMHAKDRKSDNRKKSKELSPDQSEEVQTDLSLGSKLTSDSLNSDVCVTEKSQEENKIKEADSMDGVFIPSCEPPKNMEEDEETNGLDITITFPEFSQLYNNGTESHLSVCLSDISAEALKKLKRCPKDFTLRMDFVEGKVLFQSGRGPANNFQIGPDLKFAENFVDTKKSDVISIKPSTECSFGSQLIPVDNPKENKSFKSLKSTDSELFNVVSLPFLYKNPYLAASHKSCIAFRNDQIMSMAIIAKHFFKSMPQIPSLTNIFEDKEMENPSKTAFQIQEKRRRNRQNQKRWTSASSVL